MDDNVTFTHEDWAINCDLEGRTNRAHVSFNWARCGERHVDDLAAFLAVSGLTRLQLRDLAIEAREAGQPEAPIGRFVLCRLPGPAEGAFSPETEAIPGGDCATEREAMELARVFPGTGDGYIWDRVDSRVVRIVSWERNVACD